MFLTNTRIIQRHFGEPDDVLLIEHAPLMPLAECKVRVQVEATNINPSDLLSIRGVGQYKHSHQPPRVPGFEAVGVIVESDEAAFPVGLRVLVATGGTWQTFVDVSPENLFPIPEHLSAEYACQLYINALTAWILTTVITKLTPNDVVIINAGRSAIGKIFAQLSQTIGFKLIAVTSQPELYNQLIRANRGVYAVLDAKQDLLQQIQQLHLIKPNVAFDALGGQAGATLLQTMKANGQFINYGTLSMALYPPEFYALSKSQQVHFSTFFLRYWEDAAGKDERRVQFVKMLDHFLSNTIQMDIDRSVVFGQIKEAIRLIESRTTDLTGKIILKPA